MSKYFGDFSEDETVYIPFNTFSSDDPAASVTITNLADADIKVHKDGGTTEIATDGATIAIDFDGITGNHLITIDTSVDAAYSTGSDYMVRIEGTTVDAGTVNAWVGTFSIQNRHMRGTDSAATATALATVGSNVDAILVDTGTTLPNQITGLNNFNPSSDNVARVTLVDTTTVNTDMRGTDGANTTAPNTVVPDAAGTAAALHATTDALIATVDSVVDAIKVITDALGATGAARLALSAGQIIPFTVDTATNTHTPTTTEFQADDITEATADHFNGRIVIWTTGNLAGQATDITDYSAVGGIGQFTVTALTEAPANNDTGIIV